MQLAPMSSELFQMGIDGHQGCGDFSDFGFAHDGLMV
jgi:hypothetical protein